MEKKMHLLLSWPEFPNYNYQQKNTLIKSQSYLLFRHIKRMEQSPSPLFTLQRKKKGGTSLFYEETN
jgi:hypothetical protein